MEILPRKQSQLQPKQLTTQLFFSAFVKISYADGPEFKLFQSYEGAWNMFQQNMEVVIVDNVYTTAPGNHEVICNRTSDKIFCQNKRRVRIHWIPNS